MKLNFGKCCGTCIHVNSNQKKQKVETHAAHYTVAKTERWCTLHNIPCTRESYCSDEYYKLEDKKGGARAVKIANSYNRRLEIIFKIKEIIEKTGNLNNKRYILFIKDNYLCYTYIDTNLVRKISCKDNTFDEFFKEILNENK